MRLLVLSEDLTKDLALLASLDEHNAVEFSKIGLQSVLQQHQQGLSQKQVDRVAQKLSCSPETVVKTIQALAKLMLDATKWSKNKESQSLLETSLKASGLAHAQALANFWANEALPIIKTALEAETVIDLPHCKGLEWRLDAVVASRADLDKLEPLVTINVQLSTPSSTHVVQTDPVNLAHITDQLENALKMAKGSHLRKVQRHL